MSKAALLGTSALVALSACGLGASIGMAGAQTSSFTHRDIARIRVLYNQNSNYAGNGISSMNFTSTGTAYDDQAADDFVVPKGRTWKVTEVDISGMYSQGGGPANSENVYFYRNANGAPGKVIPRGIFKNLRGTGDSGNFAIALPNGGLRLRAGHYWVSVVANMDAGCCGEWFWSINSVQHHAQAVWQNPGGAFGICQDWRTLEYCAGIGPDLMFQLKGGSK